MKKQEINKTYRFHITYNTIDKKDKFVRGHNIILEEDNIIKSINKFYEEFPDVEILGILKSEI